MSLLTSLPSLYSLSSLSGSDVERAHQLSKEIGWSATNQEWADDLVFCADSSFAVICDEKIVGVGLGFAFESSAILRTV